MSESMIRDISLADEGLQRISWVEKFMPALNTLREEFVKEQIFKGKTIVMSIHLEAKTAYLALTLKAAGANVICTGSNPLSTQDPIAAGLVKSGITVYAWHACTEEEYFMFLNKALDHMPDIIIDDGGDLVHLLHTTRKECQKNLIGGSEETTTGVYRLKILEKENKLEFPMIAVNDSYCKYLFDNRYGTGQSAWDGIIRSTNLTVTGKTAVIAGYGWCGKGCAMRAKGLGYDNLGKLEKGALADIILVDRSGYHWHPRFDSISLAVYAGNSMDVDTVIINGKTVMRHKEMTTIDTEKLYAEVDRVTEKLYAFSKK